MVAGNSRHHSDFVIKGACVSPGDVNLGTQGTVATEGRIVWNHSTHLPGLIAILEKLVKVDGIQTITPAVLSRVRSNAQRMTIKVSVPITGGFKLIARKGKTAQEVFVITKLDKEQLQRAIAQVL